ncbi:hypothetical protein PIB30_048343 [Stylosanthes scabra]|uniref:Uncharacterized protein n=1 Tax=Stylosanthes scabra TaxID=79078 RepID=A0ABU6RHL4_9FABA|nr:hypothetical protein [Stylosanthes scabra]
MARAEERIREEREKASEDREEGSGVEAVEEDAGKVFGVLATFLLRSINDWHLTLLHPRAFSPLISLLPFLLFQGFAGFLQL